MLGGKRRSIAVLIFLVFFTPSLSGKETGESAPGASLADIGKLSCDELEDFASVYGKQFRTARKVQKMAQDRNFADLEKLEHVGAELGEETLEVAKGFFAKIKALKEAGEATHAMKEALDSMIKVEALAEAAHDASASLKVLKGLKGFAKVASVATNPYVVLVIFAIDVGVEITEAISDSHNRATNSERWIRESEVLSARLLDVQREAANFFAASLGQMERKKCAPPKMSAGACFGKGCADGVVKQADHSASKNHWYNNWLIQGYEHVCDRWKSDNDFEFRYAIEENCREEVRTLIETSGHLSDPRGYPQFASTRKLLEEQTTAIRSRCENEVCRACAGRAGDDADRKLGILRICVANFATSGENRLPKGPIVPYHGPPVNYSNYDSHGRQIWPAREPTPQQRREYELERRLEEFRRKQAEERAAYVPPTPPPTPDRVTLSCECIARCLETGAGSPLGKLAYLYSRKAEAVQGCKGRYFNMEKASDQIFCPPGESVDGRPICDWRRSDETLSRNVKCEWPDAEGRAAPIENGQVIELGGGRQFESGFLRQRLVKVVRTLAACRAARVQASFCFSLSNTSVVADYGGSIGREPGWRIDCWNTDGNLEVRADGFSSRVHNKISPGATIEVNKGPANPFRKGEGGRVATSGTH